LRKLSRRGPDRKQPARRRAAFRRLGENKLYDNDFAARLQDGLSTIHPDMPTFRFDRPDAEAAVNYLKFIQEHKRAK